MFGRSANEGWGCTRGLLFKNRKLQVAILDRVTDRRLTSYDYHQLFARALITNLARLALRVGIRLNCR